MAKIYRKTDRINIKIDDVTLKIAPLSGYQKSDIQHAMIVGRSKGDIREASKGIALAIKYAVKGIEGVYDSDDKPYVLKFEGDDLTDDCVDDLLNMQITTKMVMVCSALANGVPSEFTDENGKKIEGVEIVKPTKSESDPKN